MWGRASAHGCYVKDFQGWPRSGRKNVARGEASIASVTPGNSNKHPSRVSGVRKREDPVAADAAWFFSISSRGLRAARRPWLHSFSRYAAKPDDLCITVWAKALPHMDLLSASE
jgi:hypothetical protein